MAFTPEQLELYNRLSNEGDYEGAYQALYGNYVAPAPAASAASGLLSSLNSSDSSALQGLLSQFRRAEEERQFADAGRQSDAAEAVHEEYNWGAVDPETGLPYISDSDLSKIISGGDKKGGFNPFDYTSYGSIAKAVRDDRVKKASEEATRRYRMIEPTGNPSFSTGITYNPNALPNIPSSGNTDSYRRFNEADFSPYETGKIHTTADARLEGNLFNNLIPEYISTQPAGTALNSLYNEMTPAEVKKAFEIIADMRGRTASMTDTYKQKDENFVSNFNTAEQANINAGLLGPDQDEPTVSSGGGFGGDYGGLYRDDPDDPFNSFDDDRH